MDYVTKYYKNLSEDLQRRLNQLITEAQTTSIAMGGGNTPTPGGVDPTVNPYQQPDESWQDVPWNPNLPQNPQPPISPHDWWNNNPEPDGLDYDLDGDGELNDQERREYLRDYRQWQETYQRIRQNYDRWRKQVRDRNRQVPSPVPYHRGRPQWGPPLLPPPNWGFPPQGPDYDLPAA